MSQHLWSVDRAISRLGVCGHIDMHLTDDTYLYSNVCSCEWVWWETISPGLAIYVAAPNSFSL
jgi:hypothetical protein